MSKYVEVRLSNGELLDTSQMSVESYYALERALRLYSVVYVETYKDRIVPHGITIINSPIRTVRIVEGDLTIAAYELDTGAGVIRTTINGRAYVYRANAGVDLNDLYASVTGIAKYSPGKSLAYLKKHAQLATQTTDVDQWVSEPVDVVEVRTADPETVRSYFGGSLSGEWDTSRQIGILV